MDLFYIILDLITIIAIIVLAYISIRILIPDIKYLAGFATTRYKGRLKKRFLGKYEYHRYFLSEKSLKSDPIASKFASVIHLGYVNFWYEEYFSNLFEERLPLHVFVNWTRSIVEELMESVNPINHVHGWNNYLHNIDSFDTILRQECIAFEDYELAYLWGGVYYWLKHYIPNFNNEALLHQIEEVACHKKYLTPYFLAFKNMANNVEVDFSLFNPEPDYSSSERLITANQTALLWLAIAKQSEGDVKNKKKLAPMIHQLTGVGEKSLEQKICGVFKDTDKTVLVDIVKPQLPNLAKRIKYIEKSDPLP